ncbi:MAG: phosphate regulon sensor histidine kinase PhoR [Gammaproteobacteria bacterium]|nr:phosphate regulon sensor histidine kinase PhoR [Gammaproteobacteria bacterium]
MINNWIEEFWRILGLLGVAILIGSFIDHVAAALVIMLGGYLAWYLYNLNRLEWWLRKSRSYIPPASMGIWEGIFTELYRVQKSHQKRQKRIVQLLGRFREVTTAMPDGVIVMRAHGEIEWWNDMAGQMFELKYPTDVGQRLTNLVRNPGFHDFFQRSDRTETYNFPSPQNPNITLSVRITSYGRDQFLLMARDVTLLQRVEQIRRDFVANISHELRTPLTVMSGYLEILAGEEPIKGTALQRPVELMQQQARRMYRLVEDLMLLSRLENEQKPIKREVVAVPQMLSTLLEEAHVLSGDRHHQISLEVDAELFIYGDAKEIDSAFSNLVTNAVNYTPAGGRIELHWYQDDQGAHFAVIDNGIGIPPHHLPRLTERFYRVDVARSRETGGSGLGLAIVKHALSRHEASLRVDSEVGRGSTFICDFPSSIITISSAARHALPSH